MPARLIAALLSLLLLLGPAVGRPHCPACNTAATATTCSMQPSPHAPDCCTPNACKATTNPRAQQQAAPDELTPTPLPATTQQATPSLSAVLAPPFQLSAPPTQQRLILRL